MAGAGIVSGHDWDVAEGGGHIQVTPKKPKNVLWEGLVGSGAQFSTQGNRNPSFFRDSLLEMNIILINKLEISDKPYPNIIIKNYILSNELQVINSS